MKVDILVFGAHPDDAELCCGGTILAAVKQGKSVAVVDLTRGELGTRGTAETRDNETVTATKILGLSARENLQMRDGFFQINEANLLKVIVAIRKYQPEILLCTSPEDRHPDHGRASKLVKEAAFLSGLIKIETVDGNGQSQAAWRPKQVFHYIQDNYLEPDFIFDISETFDDKIKALLSYETQFNATDDGPKTYISSPEFIKFVEARALIFGKRIGVKYGEGFISDKALGISSFNNLVL
ncbi:bacillithiol biosynthesis deacetylase BshB1 [Arachidicoccus ginsenosidimutans]|uniref:bacillithiol biosynthesis deacetylase BshB1 n=1 Tax=Arachidicoccus sp. BS20 TaxID=1850526 RepID=UPI0007F08F58|nr:bacillithiol biosynthesis deacetylase BshB1 [Arachidicoccus sp. BS20]ANI89165.1 bacillithiol biosynthesis deacetylase BshB1 [Arachidicoccus sp. BS20]